MRIDRCNFLRLSLTVCLMGAAMSRLPAQDLDVTPVDLSKLGLTFTANDGQLHPAVSMQAEGVAGRLQFLDQGVVFTLPAEKNEANPQVAVRFGNGAYPADIRGEARRAGTVNHFIGGDRSAWRTGVSTFGTVLYENIYDGIDLRYLGTEGRLKGTWYLRAGVDPSIITWGYECVRDVRIDDDGDIVMNVGDTDRIVTEAAPIAWQFVAGRKVDVPVRFVRRPVRRVRLHSRGLRSHEGSRHRSGHPLLHAHRRQRNRPRHRRQDRSVRVCLRHRSQPQQSGRTGQRLAPRERPVRLRW